MGKLWVVNATVNQITKQLMQHDAQPCFWRYVYKFIKLKENSLFKGIFFVVLFTSNKTAYFWEVVHKDIA